MVVIKSCRPGTNAPNLVDNYVTCYLHGKTPILPVTCMGRPLYWLLPAWEDPYTACYLHGKTPILTVTCMGRPLYWLSPAWEDPYTDCHLHGRTPILTVTCMGRPQSLSKYAMHFYLPKNVCHMFCNFLIVDIGNQKCFTFITMLHKNHRLHSKTCYYNNTEYNCEEPATIVLSISACTFPWSRTQK